MVYLHFPSQLTEEEEMLKKKYEKLRRKKKAFQNLNAPKQEPPPPKPLKRPLEAKPDAKEVAKKLLKSGAISAIKVENKERQGFKRPKALERKRNACDKTNSSVTGYQPFSASHSLEEELPSLGSPNDSASDSPNSSGRPPVRKLYESFVSSRKLEDEIKEERARENQRRERDRDGRPERPRQGNTIYVRGYGVTQEILQKAFEPVGSIINISMEMDKNCGFVTFEKIEQAETAIKEVNGTTISGVRLNVSLARRQPLIPPLGEDSSSSSWATLAVNFPQKANHADSRNLIVYEDI
ncbi:negative elongation factor E-like [Stegodyphus dumicola]|uniref:negative elongation factor E-like n=1 Tax=Stegodyphus dumicola TaxID=202533 RepID=UPI0015AF0A22|nr:negative elongation factor E-like [Stegodyphus dumicola]XP_035220475.1 negative elongation factor E-like [Stegodyphus dumicola]XP_035220476.1 negative elongation factor E-like [Stegodyphus dumicola]XP_035220477.1 negative elongation factor E-like [Stegodyphus dumicola]